ncbi:hypothetical protein ACFRIC_19865 [Streptomyces sp. NPDC056738]|uniref:hypothetical protein n=1 Tax=Streptomyces sp. NPDC056738 TaxID=3345933 RepID=UPI003675AC68
MDFETATLLKRNLVCELLNAGSQLSVEAWRSRHYRPLRPLPPGTGLALGVTGLPAGGYGIAIRIQEDTEPIRDLAALIAKTAHGEVDVRVIGRVRAHGAAANTSLPLRPGLSVSHPKCYAGTLGAFVSVGDEDGLFAISSNHVLAASNRGRAGDMILQPGRPQGRPPKDRIGSLHDFMPLLPPSKVNTLDAAICRLDQVPVLAHWAPIGCVSRVTTPRYGVHVEKIGKTTGPTRGFIKTVDLAVFGLDYEIGSLRFDEVIEVEGLDGPFSRKGDSGALVYTADSGEGVGLLFGGRLRPPDRGPAVSYVCRLDAVLNYFNAHLLTSEELLT